MKRMLKPLLLGIISVAAGSAAADRITFYADDNFAGRQFSADQPVSNFARSGFNDRVNSAVVHEGRWEICVDAEFRGGCAILAPGAYPNLGAYANRISSVRPLDGRYSDARPAPNYERPDDRGRNREARATLYEGPNLSGRAFPLNEAVANLGRTGFNDRASSLRVESGYWIFCSDSEFRGECRTFGPGDYASLPGLNNAISSGRRISNTYPYGDRPDWRDGNRPSQGSYRP
ncbi:MAG: beta/gamma crystallin-related protein [Casimicrobiaceae bacterium]